jgi:hypothetical protein
MPITIDPMTTREQIDKALDGLPPSELKPVLDFIVARTDNGNDAKPGDVIDEWGNLSAMKRHAAARKMKRLTQEEIAANGQTLAEAWGVVLMLLRRGDTAAPWLGT